MGETGWLSLLPSITRSLAPNAHNRAAQQRGGKHFLNLTYQHSLSQPSPAHHRYDIWRPAVQSYAAHVTCLPRRSTCLHYSYTYPFLWPGGSGSFGERAGSKQRAGKNLLYLLYLCGIAVV